MAVRQCTAHAGMLRQSSWHARPRAAPQVVQEVASNLGISGSALDHLFTLEPLTPNAPEPLPGPITFRNALANYLDLDARPSPAALAVFAECVEDADRELAAKLNALASSSQEYQRWVVVEQPRWRDVWSLFGALQGRLPVERLFELCPAAAPRYYSVSSSLFAAPDEVAVTVSQLAYHLPDGRKRKARPRAATPACDSQLVRDSATDRGIHPFTDRARLTCRAWRRRI